MIDWSSSDYTTVERNLFYIPDVEGGVYLSKKDDLNEHLCYECTDKTKSEKSTESVPQSDIQGSDEFTPAKKQQQPPIQIQYIPVPMQPVQQMQPIQQMPTTIPLQQPVQNVKSNFVNGLLGTNEVVFIFIALLLFLVFVELRISNVYQKLKNQTYRDNRTS